METALNHFERISAEFDAEPNQMLGTALRRDIIGGHFMAAISLIDGLHMQRAIRYFRADPIPDSVIEAILDAAIRAPSGGNSQRWAFVVIKDKFIKSQLAILYKEYWDTVYSLRIDKPSSTVSRSAEHLANSFGDSPAIIIPCIRGKKGSDRDVLTTGASIYPAAQNIMLAALSQGVGSVITTFLQNREEEVSRILNIPDDYQTACAIPMGYPSGEETFGGSRRKPLSDVVHFDQWSDTQ